VGILFIAGAILIAVSLGIAAGYALWLARPASRAESPQSPQSPPVLVIVPVYDERSLIERKLMNLDALTYPHARFAIVDGGSADGTIAFAEQWIAGRHAFHLLETTHRDKTAQLNEALRTFAKEEWIVVTDADALLEPDTIERLLQAADANTGVVGAAVRPLAAHALELLHWRVTGWLRAREHEHGSAALVSAPCYLARRECVAPLPADAVADDVYVACRAMLGGRRVAQSSAVVVEARSPRTLGALLRHKYRKADAYLREIARFLPASRSMPRAMRIIFLWRAALLTIVPLAGILGGLLVFAAMPVLLVPVALAAALRRGVALAALLAIVSAAALLLYPFSTQMASFPKIAEVE
jgi:cellulose synthase/poly-beta-1,6-N-acetylglucosamine synthase-like glycosyltransferase